MTSPFKNCECVRSIRGGYTCWNCLLKQSQHEIEREKVQQTDRELKSIPRLLKKEEKEK